MTLECCCFSDGTSGCRSASWFDPQGKGMQVWLQQQQPQKQHQDQNQPHAPCLARNSDTYSPGIGDSSRRHLLFTCLLGSLLAACLLRSFTGRFVPQRAGLRLGGALYMSAVSAGGHSALSSLPPA